MEAKSPNLNLRARIKNRAYHIVSVSRYFKRAARVSVRVASSIMASIARAVSEVYKACHRSSTMITACDTYHREGMMLQNRRLVLPFGGNQSRDEFLVLWNEEGASGRCLQSSVVQLHS